MFTCWPREREVDCSVDGDGVPVRIVQDRVSGRVMRFPDMEIQAKRAHERYLAQVALTPQPHIRRDSSTKMGHLTQSFRQKVSRS